MSEEICFVHNSKFQFMLSQIMIKIELKSVSVTLIVLVLFGTMLSCKNQPNKQNPYLHEQGVFEFLGETADVDVKKELPANVDPEKVLCFGKGLKVGRCISKQLESGICVGLIKNHKHVIALEIPCETVTQDSVQEEQILLE